MKHLDLFSGIGGFAYAADQVWESVEHVFCDNDKFCQQVLKKHWPNSKIYDDIKLITDTGREYGEPRANKSNGGETERSSQTDKIKRFDLLTGGFPCQPFSQAGPRRGTSDDRYLWEEMARVIQLTTPTWIIAENVRGLLNIEGGLVFEQVCLDLEALGYEVQAFVVPACAVNAPHRRDRIWIIAYQPGKGLEGSHRTRITRRTQTGWDKDWLKVATELCGVDDGLPAELDGFELSKSQHRKERLKSLGNAIVPQVAIEVMKAIEFKS